MPRLHLRGPLFFSRPDPGLAAILAPKTLRCFWCLIQESNSNDLDSSFECNIWHEFAYFVQPVRRLAQQKATHAIREIIAKSRHLCIGRQHCEPCQFSTSFPGYPARATNKRRCALCAQNFPQRVTANKKFFTKIQQRICPALDRAFQEKLLRRIPEDTRDAILGFQNPIATWNELLTQRQTLRVFTNSQRMRYRQHILNDQRRARRALGLHEKKQGARRGEQIINTTTLPAAKIPLARAFESWCHWDSWAICERCKRAQPRDLTERMLLSETQPACDPTIEPVKCSNCAARRKHAVPAPNNPPKPLRNLEPSILEALSPLQIITGPVVRAHNRPSNYQQPDTLATGYRQHSAMIRFAWHEESVPARIADLSSHKLRSKANTALDFLIGSRISDYAEFYEEHEAFLRASPDADFSVRLRPLVFIERAGLENALWPNLFWSRQLCFSHERLTDPRRLQKAKKQERRRANNDLLKNPEENQKQKQKKLQTQQENQEAQQKLATHPITHNNDNNNSSNNYNNNTNNNNNNNNNNGKEGEEATQQQQRPTLEAADKNEEYGNDDDDDNDDDDGDDNANDDADGNPRHSAKGSFAAKALGPLLDYGSSFDILQYVYDLTLWSNIGSKRTIGEERVPLRLMMKGYPFSPLYWKSLHLALIDMVRQLGPPALFWTFAPYEWSFPYHAWIRDSLAKQLRGRLFLPIPETLHLAHVMTQIARGLLTGRSNGVGRYDGGRWTKHLLYARDGRGQILDLPFFSRLEFQDGTRKQATQDYHGSGRPHVHVLIFCSRPELLPLGQVVSASASSPAPKLHTSLKCYALGSQLDHSKNSGRDVCLEPSHYDESANAWYLYHTPRDKALGFRAFFLVIMDALKCHQDLQIGEGMGLLAAYVAKYVSKFSSSALDDWLDDYLEAHAVSANFLFRYMPFEPEMILQIFGQRFRQWDISTVSRGKRDFRVPLPGSDRYPVEIAQYVESRWRSEDMNLLDFLRKTNSKGQIAGWLRQKYKKENSRRNNINSIIPKGSSAASPSSPLMDLNGFANAYIMQGEQVVAADVHSRNSDTFYGQWLLLHVPFRNPNDLLDRKILALAPEGQKFLANLLHCKHPRAEKFWRNDHLIKIEMQLEGHAAAHITSTLRMLHANRELINDYLKGEFRNPEDANASAQQQKKHTTDKHQQTDDAAAIHIAPPVVALPDKHGIIRAPLPPMSALNAQQRRFVSHVTTHMRSAKEKNSLSAPEDQDVFFAQMRLSKAIVCMGPPGTGKTTAARLAIQEALNDGDHVLLALPTAQLASNLRAFYVDCPNMTINTCASVFGLMEDPCESLPHLDNFALIMVDEFSQLTKIHFERIVKLWASVDKLPALLFCGDPYQMSGFGNRRPWHSRLWRSTCDKVRLVQAYRCKDKDYWKTLSALRTAQPTERLLRSICTNRKAWNGPPTVHKLRQVLRRYPGTTILTCTRRGAATLNDLVLRATFPKRKPIVHLPGDVDSNPNNYDVGGNMKPPKDQKSLWIPIHHNMKICLTQNVRKDDDFVNGMTATVEHYYKHSKGLRVLTATGHRIVIYKWKNPRDRDLPAHYPIRPGYASTIMKYQGSELAHVTVYLDAQNVPGAAYTALSRVQTRRQYRLAGRGLLKPAHFTPVEVSGLT